MCINIKIIQKLWNDSVICFGVIFVLETVICFLRKMWIIFDFWSNSDLVILCGVYNLQFIGFDLDYIFENYLRQGTSSSINYLIFEKIRIIVDFWNFWKRMLINIEISQKLWNDSVRCFGVMFVLETVGKEVEEEVTFHSHFTRVQVISSKSHVINLFCWYRKSL